jgi:hypothetical protein
MVPRIDSTAPNFTYVDLGKIGIWFSYKTPIASVTNEDRFVSQNIWSSTTGKHLNIIDGGKKDSRIPNDEFVKRLNKFFR